MSDERSKSIFDKIYSTLVHPANRNPLIYSSVAGTATFALTFLTRGKLATSYIAAVCSYAAVFKGTEVYERHRAVLDALDREQFRDFSQFDMITRGTDIDEKLYEKPINYGRRF